MNKKSRTRLLVATGVIVAVFIVGVVFLVQKQGAYYRQVSDLTTGQYDGKNVKVGGRVLDGTIERDASGVLFTIEDLTGKPDTVKVLYSGQMPNTFDAGVDVVVIGKYASNGALITADQLQTKCPSKYKGSGLTRCPVDRAVRSDACEISVHTHSSPRSSSPWAPRGCSPSAPGLSARTSSATATTPSTASS